MTRVIAVANQKGGVGKTTISTQLAYYVSDQLHQRTLLVDMDPQGNASAVLNLQNRNAPSNATTTAQLFNPKLEDVVPTQVIDFVDPETNEATFLSLIQTPSNDRNLAAIELMHTSAMQIEKGSAFLEIARTFRKNLKKIEGDYDCIIFDCPPSLNAILTSALLYCDVVVSPITLPSFASDSISGIRRTISNLQTFNAKLRWLGIITNNFDGSKTEEETLDEVRGEFGRFVFDNVIRHRSPIGRASKLGNPIWIEKNGSIAAKEMKAVFEELFERWNACASKKQ